MYKEQILEYLRPYSRNDENLERMADLVAQKMTAKPCQPDPNIAGQALDMSSWSNNTMRNRYASLLTASMTPEKRAQVHPAFISVASQMDALDYALLLHLSNQVVMSVADCYICRTRREGGFGNKQTEVPESALKLVQRMTEFLPEDGDYSRVQASIDNLLRQQLIVINMKSQREPLEDVRGESYENIYMLFEPVITETKEKFQERFPEYANGQLRLRTGVLTLTAFGRRFVRSCMDEQPIGAGE